MKKAISYIRFSSKQQATGDSLKRQGKLIQSWLKDNPDYSLDEKMQFTDLGLSGYSRANVEKGAFGEFLAAVKAGYIPQGAVLLVESLDRISREDIDAAGDQLRNVLRAGVDVVTLQDGSWYKKDSLKDSLSMIKAILIMQRAHEESLTKSTRVRSGWERSRQSALETGKPMSKRCVAWLRLSEDGKCFEFVPEHVEAVKKVFELRLSGMSHIKIAAAMNTGGYLTLNQYKPRAGGWSQSTITDLLSNRSVIGYKVPSRSMKAENVKEIPGYYPPVISETEFYAVQQMKTGAGRRPASDKPLLTNIFKGVMRCAQCGYVMILSGVTDKRHGNYRCSVKYENKCSAKGISRLQTDKALLEGLLYNAHRLNLSGSDDEAIRKLRTDLESLQKQRDRLVRLSMLVDDTESVASELRPVNRKIKEAEAALANAHQREKSAQFDDVRHLDMSVKKERIEAQLIVKRLIKEIRVDTAMKVCRIEFYSGLVFTGYPLDKVIDGARDLEVLPLIGYSEVKFVDGKGHVPNHKLMADAPDWVKNSDDTY